jgi:hypothetical protein
MQLVLITVVGILVTEENPRTVQEVEVDETFIGGS